MVEGSSTDGGKIFYMRPVMMLTTHPLCLHGGY